MGEYAVRVGGLMDVMDLQCFPSRYLMDSKLTNSRSQFLSRVQDDKLQFQLDAFRFAQEARSAMSKLLYSLGSCILNVAYMSLFSSPGAQYEATAVLGPTVVQEAADDMPDSYSSLKADDGAEGTSETMVMARVIAAVGQVSMIVLGTVLLWRLYKPLLL
ncbi:hypothetical protein SKAU_G00385000 [Synaphobranchus kaupii]|uniref:Uncharacterized protein n=1 Tax=Synaphobranchus kaupii TaxID=118154 RepID=A0A9Q1EEG4_SYNKA|nr:hypothetical protein SKAU_G00385000 [Synaphobranchus kaupii]